MGATPRRDQLGKDGDCDLGGRRGADIQPDRAMDPGDVRRTEACLLQTP
jgi:hypothetical protein